MWYAIRVNFIFSVFFGLMFNLKGPQGQNPRDTVWETLHYITPPLITQHFIRIYFYRTDNYRQWNAVGSPDDGHKDARNMLRHYWLPINHYLLHLVVFSFIYLSRMHGHSNIKSVVWTLTLSQAAPTLFLAEIRAVITGWWVLIFMRRDWHYTSLLYDDQMMCGNNFLKSRPV